MSIATSTEDESNFELDVVPEDDDLFLAGRLLLCVFTILFTMLKPIACRTLPNKK